MPRDQSAVHQRIATLLGGELGDHTPVMWIVPGPNIGGERYDLTSFDDGLRLWAEYAKGWEWKKAYGLWTAFSGRPFVCEVPDTNDPAADFTALLAAVLDAGRSKP